MEKTSELIWQDTQHQELFRLIDKIKEDGVEADIFVRLYDYAEHHFSLEEAYMRESSYPDIDSHIAAHNKFRQELTNMVTQHHDYDEALRESLATFLSEWLKRHIWGIDKQFEDYILRSDIK